jgi:streptomycin 6-kinase
MPHADLVALVAPWLGRWRLNADGPAFATRTSILAPVLHAGAPAMLKLAAAAVAEERRGADLMEWYGGDAAACVIARDGDALLLERATGSTQLVTLARRDDDQATDIICSVVARLHRPRAALPPKTLLPLPDWFESLRKAGQREGGFFARALTCAEALLADQRDMVPLHGDIHHRNILDAEPRGWRAIDPKGLIGERAFDYANLFCNPDAAIALKPGRLERRLARVAAAARLDEDRLRKWVFAYAALSAAWALEDEDDPALAFAIARLTAA